MNRIDETFLNLKKEGKKALIVYLTAGYPCLGATEKIALEISRRGADIIELGIPFSDPLADGPTIQKSSHLALAGGADIDSIFETAARIRKKTEVPIAFMTYYNPVYSYQAERFTRRMKKTGVDGIIVPDLPVEECTQLKQSCLEKDISLILLAAANTPHDRLRLIADSSTGFIYCLSHIGVTGARQGMLPEINKFTARLRKMTDKPLAVGFGISEPGHVRLVNSVADGAIVGSAVIDVIRKNAGKKNLVKITGDFVQSLKAG